MKKVLLLAISLAFIASLSLTGTLAFFSAKKQEDLSTKFIGTDATPNAAVLSAGEPSPSPTPVPVVRIQQQTLMDSDEGLAPLSEGDKPDLLPSPMFNFKSSGSAPASLPGNELWTESGAVDNIIQVQNTGDLAAYMRTVFAVENSGSILDEGLIYLNYNTSDGVWRQITDSGSDVTIDGTKYRLFEYVYTAAVQPGASSPYSLKQVAMDAAATNEDVAPLGGDFKILSYTQAVSATGFDSASESVKKVFGEVTSRSHPWNGSSADADETVAAVSY